MNMCDLDGDGKIDYLEFIQSAINHKSLINKENVQIVFSIFDQNQDGKISIEELKSQFSIKAGINSNASSQKVL